MNESKRKEVERVALVQRVQLEALHVALQTLEDDVGALESESARQFSELTHLDEKIGQIYEEAGMERPSTQGLAPDRPGPSSRDAKVGHQRTTGPSSKFVSPDVGEDWDAYLRNVEQYIADHGIEVSRDPLEQLLPPHRAAEIRRRFDAEFSPAPWDHWDYSIISLAVLVGAVTDYLLVATPGRAFKGQPQRGSPLTVWMKEQSEKLAPMAGADGIERNAFQQWVANLTTDAQKQTKVPYDVVTPKVGLTPNVHRLANPGHDPLLGLVFGVRDIISGSCTFIDKSGAWQVIPNASHGGTNNLLEALVKVFVHGFSDIFTPQGLPAPFLAPFQLVNANSGFILREGGDPVSVRDVVRYMYSNGYDLRHFVTTTISPGVAEVILWAYHAVRDLAAGAKPGEVGLPAKLKRAQMLAFTHGLLASANILKTALYGWNPMAINLAQFQALAMRLLSLWKLASERDRLVRQKLEDGWESLLTDAHEGFSSDI